MVEGPSKTADRIPDSYFCRNSRSGNHGSSLLSSPYVTLVAMVVVGSSPYSDPYSAPELEQPSLPSTNNIV